MIELINVTKKYKTRKGSVTVLRDVNFKVEKGQKIGILGRNGAGKSTLIRLIGGVEPPTEGQIVRTMKISWPMAFSGGFQGSLSGIDNIKFISRIYEADIGYVRDFVEDFAELGDYLYEPVKKYSSGMRARLAFGLSMAIEFDCYLIDEVIAVGDARFAEKCKRELFEKRSDRSLILVSHNVKQVREHCDVACVLKDGTLRQFDNLNDAYAFYG